MTTLPDLEPAAIDWQRVDDALVSCAGLLKTLCRDELGDTCAAELEYARSALASRSVPEAGKAVEVKPLEWDPIREVVNEPWAKSTVRQSIGRHNLGPYAGSYSVQEITRDGDWGWWTTWEASREPQGILKTEVDAKAAAQADFERRIRSALVQP